MQAYLRDITVLQRAGFDGFASLTYFARHLQQLHTLKKNPPQSEYAQMIVFPGKWSTNQYAEVKNMIIEAAKSPYTARVNNKLLIWSYGGGAKEHGAWAQFLRNDKDIPPFMFIGNMPFYDVFSAYVEHVERGGLDTIPAGIIHDFRQKVEQSAQVLDGFHLWCTRYYADHLGEYPRYSQATDIYRKYLLPIMLEIMARPEHKDKLIGAYLRNGYINPFTGVTDGEYGTKTLRTYLDEILLANPDVLVLFEWNESNENTHFQPTIAHGHTWERVVAYYKSLLDKTPPIPRPGDDISIPNLILSFRQALRIGEPYHLELLYLPDSSIAQEVVAQITLKDEKGRLLTTLPVEKILTRELVAVDYRIASESFAGVSSIMVELETEYAGKKKKWSGFDATRLDLTTCRDYLYSHHPLRELLVPQGHNFVVTPLPGKGSYKLTASFECDEPLATLEVLEGRDELAAADLDNIFDHSRYAIFRGAFTTACTAMFGSGRNAIRSGTMRIPGVTNAVLKRGYYPWSTFAIDHQQGDWWKLRVHMGGGVESFFLLVPRVQLAGAKLLLDFEGVCAAEFALDDIFKVGKKGVEMQNTIRLDLERLYDLADYPPLLDNQKATLDVEIQRNTRFPAFQLRAVSMSGKVWRSQLQHPVAYSSQTCGFQVFSETIRESIPLNVASDRIPDLVYSFDPVYGDWLPCNWESRYDAKLGGAAQYGEPLHNSDQKSCHPADFVRSAPEWAMVDGYHVLRFQRGSYLALPQEALPRSTVYEVSFEIKPDTNENQVLLRPRLNDGLQLVYQDNTLRVSHFGVKMVPHHFDTGLSLGSGKWNKVVVQKDFEQIRCTVNDQSASFNYDRRALRFHMSVFGGNVAPGPGIPQQVKPFSGLLRALRIRHTIYD